MNEQYINQLINEGYLSKKENADLYLLCYTNKCIYEKKWNSTTLNNRGHIYEKGTNKLIAKPFSKFFNLGELSVTKQRALLERTDYNCYEKMDGSLGIIYNYNGKWRVNTRGSFDSEQAYEAEKMIEEKHDLIYLPTDLTLLVEIIYPENRIVINYGNERKLVLLAAYKTGGREAARRELEVIANMTNIELVKEYDLSWDEMFEFQETEKLDHEGIVVKFFDGYRIKIKSKKYFAIARIITNLSPLSLWKNMKEGKVQQEYLEVIPEEFRLEINKMTLTLEFQYKKLRKEIFKEFGKIDPICTRKEIALRTDLEHRSCMFSLLDLKYNYIDTYIMKHIRPRGNKNE